MSSESIARAGKRPPARVIAGLAVTVALAAAVLLLVPATDVAYRWMKAAHVISVIAWMAAMLYLPRLFVYHADVEPDSATSATFKIMERRLMQAIMNPAMIATWIFGVWLAWRIFHFQGGWLHAKITLVIAMSALHGYYAGSVRRFAEDRNRRPARHWRIMNEVPAVLLIAIVILVIVKPF